MCSPDIIVNHIADYEISCSSLSWALRGPCCVHPWHPVLHFEIVNVPGHVVTNDETSSPPLCWSCGLITNMHLQIITKQGE